MSYFLNLFSPETWQKFRESGSVISGFRHTQLSAAGRVTKGSSFVCYLTGLSRWSGLLEIEEGPFEDSSPIFSKPDPFVVRFRVKPLVVLEPEKSIPIYDDLIWPYLSFTRHETRGTSRWTGKIRASLAELISEDGNLLARLLTAQAASARTFPITDEDRKKLRRIARIPTIEGDVAVEVPDRDDDVFEFGPDIAIDQEPVSRQSTNVQARLADIGAKMHFRIWIPPSDRARVSTLVAETTKSALLDRLPLNYDDVTLRTIEQIDVIWLKGRAMARAFEVEHTTAVYSGILRMADLLALQPNMNIRLHIVAPDERREKVKLEIKRPVFSLLQPGPLYNRCTFLSYSAIDQLQAIEHLQYMNDEIIAEYEESAEE